METRAFQLNDKLSASEVYNELSNRITKAYALAKTSAFDDILESVHKDHADYLWVLSDILREMKELVLKELQA